MRTSALFSAKKSGFFEIMVCPHGQGRLSQCGYFADKGRGFCADVFYGRPLVSFSVESVFYEFNCYLLDTRMGKASAVMRALQYSVVLKQKLSKNTKLSVFKTVFVPILIYGLTCATRLIYLMK